MRYIATIAVMKRPFCAKSIHMTRNAPSGGSRVTAGRVRYGARSGGLGDEASEGPYQGPVDNARLPSGYAPFSKTHGGPPSSSTKSRHLGQKLRSHAMAAGSIPASARFREATRDGQSSAARL